MSKNTRAKFKIDQHTFVKAEIKAIEIAKWLAGEKLNKDPGDEFILVWIRDHAKEFRKKWKTSKCQYCSKEECRYKNLTKCEKFNPISKLS